MNGILILCFTAALRLTPFYGGTKCNSQIRLLSQRRCIIDDLFRVKLKVDILES